jgi:hypothetical protein
MVMMWPDLVRLATSIKEAIVVDLPDPVGPVINTRPRVRWAKSSTTSGSPRSSSLGIEYGMTRNAAVDVQPEPADSVDRVGGVQLGIAREALPLLVTQGGADQLEGVLGAEDRPARESVQRAVQPHGRCDTDREVEVGTAQADRLAQHRVQRAGDDGRRTDVR